MIPVIAFRSIIATALCVQRVNTDEQQWWFGVGRVNEPSGVNDLMSPSLAMESLTTTSRVFLHCSLVSFIFSLASSLTAFQYSLADVHLQTLFSCLNLGDAVSLFFVELRLRL